MIWVTAEDVGCCLVGTVHRHDVGEVLMCIADGSTEVGDLSASCPVAETDRHAIRVLVGKTVDV